MKLLPALGLALVEVSLLGAAPRVPTSPFDPHSSSVQPQPTAADVSFGVETRQRMTLAARNCSLAPWQRKFMMKIAGGGDAGLERDVHGASSTPDGTWSRAGGSTPLAAPC